MRAEIKAGHYFRRRDGKIAGPAKLVLVGDVECVQAACHDGIKWHYSKAGSGKLLYHEAELIEDLGPVDPRTLPVTESATIVPRGEAQQSQVGGSHYKDMVIQPFDYIHANGIPFAEGNVIKYVSRWRSKGGVEDLKKARHFLDMLIEKEEQSK